MTWDSNLFIHFLIVPIFAKRLGFEMFAKCWLSISQIFPEQTFGTQAFTNFLFSYTKSSWTVCKCLANIFAKLLVHIWNKMIGTPLAYKYLEK